MNAPYSTDTHQPLRQAVRDLCGAFDGEYWRRIDEERGYPEAFIKALEEAGWLGARHKLSDKLDISAICGLTTPARPSKCAKRR